MADTVSVPPSTVALATPRPRARRVWRALLSNPATVFGGVVMAIILFLAVFGPLVTPMDPLQQDLTARYLPPFWDAASDPAHLLGTDQLGRDVLSRTIAGTRVSVTVGVGSVVMQMLIGVTVGLLAGYLGGWIDTAVSRVADVLVSVPFLVLALAISAILGPGIQNTILVLGLVGWVSFARLVRAETLSMREREFVLAARTSGRGSAAIMFNDVLPNVSGSIIVVGTLQLSQMIIAESSLSFLGLGVQPPGIAWGSMIAEGMSGLMVAAWVVAVPGVALMFTTVAVNLLGDGLRDQLDPKGRTR